METQHKKCISCDVNIYGKSPFCKHCKFNYPRQITLYFILDFEEVIPPGCYEWDRFAKKSLWKLAGKIDENLAEKGF